MSKQSPRQTPADDERGSLAHPPWLTGETQRRRVPIGREERDRDKTKGRDRAEDKAGGNGRGSSTTDVPAVEQRTPSPPAAAPPRFDPVPASGTEPDVAHPPAPAPEPAEQQTRRVAVRRDRVQAGRPGEAASDTAAVPTEPVPAPPPTDPASSPPPAVSQVDESAHFGRHSRQRTEAPESAARLKPSEPEPPVEVSTGNGWEPAPSTEASFESPTPESLAPEEPRPDEAGALDEIELRAAALLEQMQAKRAQFSSAAAEEPDDRVPPADATARVEEWLPTEIPAPEVESQQPVAADDPTPTEWHWTDMMAEVSASQSDAPQTDSTVEARPAESDTAAPAANLAGTEPDSTERQPEFPPWQMPISTTSGTEVVKNTTASTEPPPAPRAPPTPPARPRQGALPPFPPPLPPGPFPPPWWPGPPPGQRLPPAAPQRPARPVAGPPPRAPGGPPPARGPQPPVGPPPSYQPFRAPPPIDEAEVANLDRFAPPSGWRRAVHKATSGHVNPGASRKERRHEHLLAEIRQPIVGDFRIAVLSIKGGVGKTTTTFGLGSALATVRHDRVIAVDANPDRGTLGERVGDASTRSTVRDLLSDPNINRYADVRNHTLMATSRLEVLASEQDPAVSEVFGADDYRRTVEILRHFYNIILTDCGTGIMHSAMSAVLDLAHTIVLVSSPAIDAARSASATLDWLVQHGHSGLVREAHVVLSASRPGSAALKLDKVYEHFQTRCRSIHLIPFDPHLAEGADVDFDRLRPATRQAYLELAGSVSENFGRLRGGAPEQA